MLYKVDLDPGIKAEPIKKILDTVNKMNIQIEIVPALERLKKLLMRFFTVQASKKGCKLAVPREYVRFDQVGLTVIYNSRHFALILRYSLVVTLNRETEFCTEAFQLILIDSYKQLFKGNQLISEEYEIPISFMKECLPDYAYMYRIFDIFENDKKLILNFSLVEAFFQEKPFRSDAEQGATLDSIKMTIREIKQLLDKYILEE